jgi:ribonucleoside-diphosphate reductase alpha chain
MLFVDSFQKEIWESKYKYKDETYEGFCERIAKSIFPDDEFKYNKLKNSTMEFRTLFGGRINSNIGIDEQGLTLFNCFIETTPKNPDSLEGIFEMVTNYALTLKTEGGVGFCANFFRPSRTIIRKIGVTSPGPIKFLEIFDKVSEVITSGSVSKEECYQGIPSKNSIRKGATMVTMSITHPDIEEFITAKAIPNKLTKMNMSVLITDAFMYAVEKDLDWDLWFPDINCEEYDEEWNGDFEKWAEKGLPVVVYRTVKANYLWELLLKNSFTRNEPGILFIDNVRRDDNLHYLKGCSVLATNPCGEVTANTGLVKHNGEIIETGDVCNLGSLVLSRYYDMETKKFSYDLFEEDAGLMVEALDNVVDISDYPIDMYKHAAKLKRKIGVGVAGIGSLFMMMGIRYGSKESVKIADKILSTFMNTIYQRSALLAKEKGPFELYSKELLEGGYVNNNKGVLTEETIELIKKYGLRNSALSAIAPNGTLSILAGNVSGGLEPVYSTEFTRWNRVEGKKMDFKYPEIHKGEWFETDYFKKQILADEEILMSTDGKYRIDKNQGLCKRVIIRDYGYNKALEYNIPITATATELSVQEHFDILSVFAKNIDLSCSKTINLPADIDFEDFKSLYGTIYKHGVKGCTTYREGTSVSVLETKKEEKEKEIKEQHDEFLAAFKGHENGDIITDVVSLPEEYPSKGYILRAEKKKWYIHVAFKDEAKTRPFAIFVNTNDQSPSLITNLAIDELKKLARKNRLGGKRLEDVEKKFVRQPNSVKVARMLGYLLRHNVPIPDIVRALGDVEDAGVGTFVFRIKKFLSQFITEPVEDLGIKCEQCGSKEVILQEGCTLCRSCGSSKCS